LQRNWGKHFKAKKMFFIVLFLYFSLCCTTLAGEICLVKEKSENNLNYYRVVSCHPVYERCCRTGCCAVQDRDKPPVQISDDVERKLLNTEVKAFLFNVLVIAVVVFLLYIVICIWVRMCLQVHRANSAPVGITTNNSHPQEVSLMLSFNSAEQFGNNEHVPLTPPPAYAPLTPPPAYVTITPPPAYNTAIFFPSVQQNGRIQPPETAQNSSQSVETHQI
jgi:hypothetical protein